MPLHHIFELLVLTALSAFCLGIALESHLAFKRGEIVEDAFVEGDRETWKGIALCGAVFWLIIFIGVGYRYGLFVL